MIKESLTKQHNGSRILQQTVSPITTSQFGPLMVQEVPTETVEVKGASTFREQLKAVGIQRDQERQRPQ